MKDQIHSATDATHGNADSPPQRDESLQPLDTKVLCCICQHGQFKTIDDFTEAVIRQYEAFYGSSPVFDDPVFRERLTKRLKQLLMPPRKAGRPPDERITTAANLRHQRVPWNKVLLQVIPGYQNLHPASRMHERIKLQHAVYMRRKGKQ